jgi:hypothetical protein
MRYLVLSADYMDFSIRDTADGEVDRNELSVQLAEALRAWNAEYQSIVRLSPSERVSGDLPEQIAKLDRRGKALAEILASDLSDVREVRYYSEGKLDYIA